MSGRAERGVFGTLADGTAVEQVRLLGAGGFSAVVITHGAALQALFVPDRGGTLADVVLGHDTAADYAGTRDFYGATVGRYANRIGGARFSLDGTSVVLAANEGGNLLHGGPDGIDRAVFAIEAVEGGETPSVTLTHTSPDGANGFPGTLAIRVTYRIEAGTTLAVDLEATSDRDTVVNLTNHSYFNLGGVERLAPVLDHELTIAAASYLPVDGGWIPTGAYADVAGTPFDFRTARAIGLAIRDDDPQLGVGRGYDHNFCLDGARGTLREVALVAHRPSGRTMLLSTDEAGLQFYSGNLLTGGAPGKHGQMARQSDAFCLEPQTFPDSPNRPEFPSARLRPGETYRHRIRYEFGTA